MAPGVAVEGPLVFPIVWSPAQHEKICATSRGASQMNLSVAEIFRVAIPAAVVFRSSSHGTRAAARMSCITHAPCLVLVVTGALGATAAAQTASVSGTVVDQSGSAVAGASVALAAARGTRHRTLTGSMRLSQSRRVVRRKRDAGRLRDCVAERYQRRHRRRRRSRLTLYVASLSDTVVVSATKSEAALLDAPRR